MYKEFTKSAGDTWDDIARRAYGTPEKGGDIAKMNNNIEAGSVLVLEEDETGYDDVKATGEIYLRYGDTDYNDFRSVHSMTVWKRSKGLRLYLI